MPSSTTTNETAAPPPPLALGSIILSMGGMALGGGLLYAYVPIKLAQESFAPWLAGTVLTVTSAGSLAGCLVTGLMVRRVGHARAYSALVALLIVSAVLLSVDTDAVLWMSARALYGFGAAGLFIISQSWLNDACVNAWRGKVIATFYLVYVLSIGTGALLLSTISIDGNMVQLLSIACFATALLPVALTRLTTPAPPATIKIAVQSVWRISPVGLVGLFVVGGLTMTLQGFAPIYATNVGYTKSEVGLLMFLMQLGLILLQYPLGALSDRIDRRVVLLAASLLVTVAALVATMVDPTMFVLLVLTFMVWSGANESIYSVANAHANDRAEPQYYVSLTSTLLIAWSLSGTLMPGISTLLTPIFGIKVFMYLTIVVSIAYLAFVFYRIRRREPMPAADTEPHLQLSAQAPLTVELVHGGDPESMPQSTTPR